MVSDMPDEGARPTAEPITGVIADRVRARRLALKMSQDELAQRMSEFGVPWKRAQVVSLEKRSAQSRGGAAGARDAITVGELFALSRALRLSPALLLADPRHTDKVPIGPDPQGTWQVWHALLWIIGLDFNSYPASEMIRLGWDAMSLSDSMMGRKEEVVYRRDERGAVVSVERDTRMDVIDREELGRLAQYTLSRLAKFQAAPLPLHKDLMRRAEELGVDIASAMDLGDDKPLSKD